MINQVVAETRLTMVITSARVTRLTRGLGADRWPRYRPLARNSRASLVTCVCHRLLLGDPRAPPTTCRASPDSTSPTCNAPRFRRT